MASKKTKNNTLHKRQRRPVILLILDGWGIGEDDAHNAIFLAKTPHLDRLLVNYPNGPIGAAGEYIGLEPGHQGSTEMGHLIIGAGRIVLLPQIQIQRALQSGAIYRNAAYLKGIRHAKKQGTRLHIMGLLSDGGVHSYDAVCHALLKMAARAGLKKDQVLLHLIADGRDTGPTSLPQHYKRLKAALAKTGVGIVADLQGRYWIMDRDHRWERVAEAYQLLTQGRGARAAASVPAAIKLARAAGEADEFIKPTVITKGGHFQNGDAVINFNYRVDREIEITQALIAPRFNGFPRVTRPDIFYVASLPYYEGMKAPTAFERAELKMKNILAEVLSAHGLTQYRLTETEKWAYITKIFNGMREKPFKGEERHLIPSDKIATYDLRPQMQAIPIAKNLAAKIRAGRHDVYIANICNADILGHTGNKKATIIGCEAIDKGVGIIYRAAQEQNAILLITADHGDAERMWNEAENVAHTQHTDSFVPFILVDNERRHAKIRETGSLPDIAPTILDLLQIKKPRDMTGSSLIIEK